MTTKEEIAKSVVVAILAGIWSGWGQSLVTKFRDGLTYLIFYGSILVVECFVKRWWHTRHPAEQEAS